MAPHRPRRGTTLAAVRLFTAVDLPPDVATCIAELPRPEDRRVRWTAPEQWHVTLRFLGELDPGVLEGPEGLVAAVQRLPDVVAGAGVLPVEAVMGPASAWFPGRRVLQVPVAGLEVLARGVSEVTRRWGPGRDQPFRGHLTLARARGSASGPQALAGAPIGARWAVPEVVLYRSIAAAGGHRYEVVHRVPLGA
jgi:2'-5' RNA ligase